MSTIINRVFFVILVYSLISCNTNKQYKKADIQQKIDSIVRIAEDSITWIFITLCKGLINLLNHSIFLQNETEHPKKLFYKR